MVSGLLHRGTWRFPAAHPIAHAGGVFGLIRARRVHAVAAVSAGIAVIAVAFATVGYIRHARTADDAQVEASRIESANIDLQDELAKLRDKIAASNRDMAAAQARVAALLEEARQHAQQAVTPPAATEAPGAPKGDKVAQLTSALHVAEAQRATLAARLSKAEADLAEQVARQAQLQAELEQWQKKLDALLAERDQLRARVGELEKQSAARQAARPLAEARPPGSVPATTAMAAPAPAASAAPAIAPAPAVGHGAIDQFARVLAAAGVDVRHLFAEFGVSRGEGGPFVAAPHGQAPANTALTPEKLAALRAMVKVLPITAPLESYDVSSPFGVRGDPENGHAGFHTGVDLVAPYDSPVYATAPGIVTYAGYRDDYGKIVEIDHGNGIATRYAHLHRYTVSVGQRVAAHTQVGYLGSTGRATGPHVHYEVVVNGEPQDPEKFIGLGRYVPMTVPVAARN
jgi:murein DD-endopeptidase MepM/ murein hydrolase activator NlpD